VLADVPAACPQDELTKFLTPHMTALGIKSWECSKPRSKGFAFLRVDDEAKGRAVILTLNGKLRHHSHRTLKFEVSNKSTRDQRAENDLNDTIAKLGSMKFRQAKHASNPIVQPRMFSFSSLSIGYYDYPDNQLRFHPSADIPGEGDLIFGRSSAAMLVYAAGSQEWKYRIDFDYWTMRLIAISMGTTPALLLSMEYAPRVFERAAPGQISARKARLQKHRVPTVDGIASDLEFRYFFVYRAQLQSMADVVRAKNLLSGSADFPQSLSCVVISTPPNYVMSSALDSLRNRVTELKINGRLKFIVAFQIIKLAVNSKLLPWTVQALLPQIVHLHHNYGEEKTAIGLREFYVKIPNRGPETSPSELMIETLRGELTRLVEGAKLELGPYHRARRNKQLQVVHK
jgi:hypothetical protein